MWWSPGIVVAGAFVLWFYHTRGTAAVWWVWLVAIVAAILIDAACGVNRKSVPKEKTTTKYYREDKK